MAIGQGREDVVNLVVMETFAMAIIFIHSSAGSIHVSVNSIMTTFNAKICANRKIIHEHE